ncbi:MAG TPA: response regulator [Steroidobacteraceae bacterium]|jgi:FixJ family two-component response regulator|nr:response regulator [Steroidobacteraceae bacterium]
MKELPQTVFVVDDDDAVRNSLRLLLKSAGFSTEVAASAQEFLSTYDAAQPGCLLLDVHMPGMTGLEMQHQLNVRGAAIPVIFITGHGDIPMAVEAMQHGAFDFLQKPFRDQELLDRVQRALTRDTEYRARLRQTERIRERLASLSPREREVLDLVTQGKANKMVAGDLGVSQRTVEIHRAHVMQKMEAGSLAELVRMMMAVAPPQ